MIFNWKKKSKMKDEEMGKPENPEVPEDPEINI